MTNKIPFANGQSDVFEFITPNLGNIKTIKISHDGNDIGSGWYLEQIFIKNKKTEDLKRYYLFDDLFIGFKNCLIFNFHFLKQFSYPVDRWLDIREADGRTSLDLEPGVKPEIKQK